jgi:hypothetical protein
VYRPLPAEQGHIDSASQLTYQDVLRDPANHVNTEIAWFGVVTSVSGRADGTTTVRLQLRTHQSRHLCRDEERSSCRVTVGQGDLGAFVVDLKLTPEESLGRERVAPGSLMKIYGMPAAERDDDNVPVIIPTYYRHWPVGRYVTTAARSAMPR